MSVETHRNDEGEPHIDTEFALREQPDRYLQTIDASRQRIVLERLKTLGIVYILSELMITPEDVIYKVGEKDHPLLNAKEAPLQGGEQDSFDTGGVPSLWA